jgi:hypothetical protein
LFKYFITIDLLQLKHSGCASIFHLYEELDMSNYNFIELPIIDIPRISDHATKQKEYKKMDEACRTMALSSSVDLIH